MLVIITDAKERGRFLKFTVVGGIGALVDFGAFNLLAEIAHVPEVYAQSISFVLAVFSNFIWNRFWTYPDSRSKRLSNQLVQFFLVNFIGLMIRTPIFALLHTPLEHLLAGGPLPRPLTPDIVGNNLALAFAVGIVLFWNFFVNRYWTYSDVD